MINNTLFFVLLLTCVSLAGFTKGQNDLSQGDAQMLFSDSSRLGRPWAKDPCVVWYNDCYQMYYSLPPYTDEQGESHGLGIGIAKSRDLVTWEHLGEMTPDPMATYEAKGYGAPCALVIDGKVHLFYQTYGNGPKDAICHAWSDDGITFIRDATNPIFQPNGTWNCGRAIDAEVIKFKDNYYLYFATRDPDFKIQMLGVAVAPGNTNFSREDWRHVSTSGPLLKPELWWETHCIEAPSVIVRDDVLYLFYAGGYNNDPQQIGVAKSIDGINWKRISDRPLLPNGKAGSWNSSESGHPDIFRGVNGETILFFQGNNNHGRTWHISKIEISWNEAGLPFQKVSF